ncbi:hypothetical protein BpHYR1_034498 [Brachionus plicatilis]|uniref:Uncharacterized protein n=1 Tax=Brachionus plicatilis TaxID=10195 RepID=A0A3M7RPY5_BRAPC|nr:hypothetical protein BpHYR1_034498 [Brachionus plicatilis]
MHYFLRILKFEFTIKATIHWIFIIIFFLSFSSFSIVVFVCLFLFSFLWTITNYKCNLISNLLSNLNYTNYYQLRVIMLLAFNNGIFKFQEQHLKQIIGLPMGCICEPTVLNYISTSESLERTV